MQFSRCSPPARSRDHGFTLVEVVVGLTLMATVLVGSLLSYSAHHRQRGLADHKREAVTIADDLLNQLTESREGIPPNGRGLIAGKPNWYWQTRVVGTAAPASIPILVIRMEIRQLLGSGVVRTLSTVEVVKAVE